MEWPEICESTQYRGQWVALDNVRFDPLTSEPLEAEVVDADEDLAELCGRMRELDRKACKVLFCSRSTPVPPRSSAPPPPPR